MRMMMMMMMVIVTRTNSCAVVVCRSVISTRVVVEAQFCVRGSSSSFCLKEANLQRALIPQSPEICPYTILGAPYYNYSIMGPKPMLTIKAPILCLKRAFPEKGS